MSKKKGIKNDSGSEEEQNIVKESIAGLDLNQQFAFISFYKTLPEKAKTTIRFFNRVEYYCVHGEDNSEISKFNIVHLMKTMGQGKRTLETAIINKSNFQALIRELLLVQHYKIEVYSTKNLKAGPGWKVEFWASPGNLTQFEDLLFSHKEKENESLVMAIKKCQDRPNTVGVAVIDLDARQIHLGEIIDDDYFSNIETFFVQKSPKECLVPVDHVGSKNKLLTILERNKIFITSRKKTEFSEEDLIQDVTRLMRFEEGELRNANSCAELNLKTATQCLRALINYLELMTDEDNFNQFTVVGIDYSRFVNLNSAVVSALNILPQRNNDKRSFSSLLYLLDRCRTAHGHRLLNQWLKQPLKDLNTIQERHAAVDILMNHTEARMNLHDDILRRMPDLQSIGIKIFRKKAGLKECYKIYEAVRKLPMLIEIIEGLTENAEVSNLNAIHTSLESLMNDMSNYLSMIETTIDMDMIQTQREFMINSTFDDDLSEMRLKMDKIKDKMNQYLERTANELNLEENKDIKLELAPTGYLYRVKIKLNKKVLDSKKYSVVNTVRGGIRFEDNKLRDANRDYQEIREQYEDHQKNIVDEMMSIAGGYIQTLNYLSGVIAELDVLVSFAVMSSGAPKPYVRPEMKEMGSGSLELEQCRHPLVEVQDHMSYIPNDVYFKKDECSFISITGPNMGGKSTFIRSVGVTVLLAQIGCHVPCDRAVISIVDQIFARIGAADAQHKGLSTFMMEMVETASILKKTTSNSLVIIDELGRGTSTYDGCGIAWSIAEYLAKDVKSFSMFATHFHEITSLSKDISTFKNFHVSAIEDKDRLVLLYQVKPGPCLQSYGIHCAKLCNFSKDVLDDAKRRMKYFADNQLDMKEDEEENVIREGEQLMDNFIEECEELCLDKLSDEEIMVKITELKNELKSKNNSYINAYLTNVC